LYLNRSGSGGKIIGAKDGVGFVCLVRTKTIVWILFPLAQIVTTTGLETTKAYLVSNVRRTSKIREATTFAESLAGRSSFAIGSKITILALTGGLGVAQSDTSSFPGTIQSELLTGVLVTLFPLPGPFADALGVAGRNLPAEVACRASPVLSTTGVGTQIDFAKGASVASFAPTSLGTTIAVRIGCVAVSRTISRTLGGFDGARCVSAFGIAVDDGFVGRLASGTDTGTMIGPGLVIEVSITAPDEFTVVLAGNETIISTVSACHTQE